MAAKAGFLPRFVITIREGRHQFPWYEQKQSRISPSDTVTVLTAEVA
jgi:hypothetical protein